MSDKLEYMLRDFGAWELEHRDHADEWGENVLYGAGIFQVRVQDTSSAGSKILCPDTQSRDVRKVQRAVAKLDRLPKAVIYAWYCAEPNEDGSIPTKSQVAAAFRMSLQSLNNIIRQAKQQIRREVL